MANKLKEILIERGKTLSIDVQWADKDTVIYKPITAIAKTAPVRITATGHGAPAGWECAVTNVVGMPEINGEANALRATDYHPATVITSDTIDFNDVNASGFSTYVSGGILQYYKPQAFAGHTFRMKIKDKIGGTVLASSEAGDAPLNILTLTATEAASKVNISITAAASAAILFSKGVTDLEAVGPTGVVTKLKICTGDEEAPDPVRVVGEVTT